MLALTDPAKSSHVLPKPDRNLELNSNRIMGPFQLHVHLSEMYRNLKQCANATSLDFYKNVTAIRDCGFLITNSSGTDMKKINQTLYIYTENSISTKTLNNDERKNNEKYNTILADNVRVIVTKMNFYDILRMLSKNTYSILLLNDNIWSENPIIKQLQLKQNSNKPHTSKIDWNNTINIRMNNDSLILEYAYTIYHFVNNLEFYQDYIKEMLENNMNAESLQEAACKYVLNNTIQLWSRTEKRRYRSENEYYIMLIYDEYDVKLHDFLPKILLNAISPIKFDVNNTFVIGFKKVKNVTDSDYIEALKKYFTTDNSSYLSYPRQQMLGAIVGNMKNISDVLRIIGDINLPVFLYEGTDVDLKSKNSVWLPTGTSIHLIYALKYFIMQMKWKRLAILSDPTEVAQTILNNLNNWKGLTLRNHRVQHISPQDAENLLQVLKAENARIIIVNTNFEDALTILTAAGKFAMNKDYVWLVRDWRRTNRTLNVTHITISHVCRNIKYVKDKDNWGNFYSKIRKVWSDGEWPIQAPGIINAVLTLVKGFEAVFQQYPQTRHDIHSELVMRAFERNIGKMKIRGVTQNLTYNGHSLDQIVIYLEEWNGIEREMIARWIVYAKAQIVSFVETSPRYFEFAKVCDGTINTYCLVTLGDPYLRTCYDIPLFVVVGIILGLFMVWMIYKKIKSFQNL